MSFCLLSYHRPNEQTNKKMAQVGTFPANPIIHLTWRGQGRHRRCARGTKFKSIPVHKSRWDRVVRAGFRSLMKSEITLSVSHPTKLTPLTTGFQRNSRNIWAILFILTVRQFPPDRAFHFCREGPQSCFINREHSREKNCALQGTVG